MCLLNNEHLSEFNEDVYYGRKMKKRKNIKDNDYKCTHTDAQRSWVGTYTHMELGKALQQRCGFKIKKIIWAWNWEKWDSGYFKEYVKTFYKIKTEADWDETRPIEERDEFIKQFKRKYDVDLDPQKMKKNEGRRFIAKHCLNSVFFLIRSI